MALTEDEFRSHADAALDRLNRSLGVVADRYDAEVMFQNGVLTIETEEPAPEKIVISPNAPVRQIWISALSRSYKLDWNGTGFALTATGEPLNVLVARLVGEQLGGVNVDLR
jgi:CyaY protein